MGSLESIVMNGVLPYLGSVMNADGLFDIFLGSLERVIVGPTPAP